MAHLYIRKIVSCPAQTITWINADLFSNEVLGPNLQLIMSFASYRPFCADLDVFTADNVESMCSP